jgi:hypothetical protein
VKPAVHHILVATALVVPFALIAADTAAQRTTGPVARYWIDAETLGGMAAMGGAGDMLAMMAGGKAKDMHRVDLRLGSTTATPASGPKADHFMPPAARIGASVPLETPRGGTGSPDAPGFERPKGRLLIYWGCGAKAGPGQPVIIDFAKVAAGQFPPDLFSTSIPVERGPTSANSTSYGHWPNALDKRATRPPESLIGKHRIAGNYSPEITFDLTRDYMAPLSVTANDGAGGTIDLAWKPLADATGYYAWSVGGKGVEGKSGDIVWWTSSTTRQFGGGLTEWLAPATVRRLIGERVVMAPTVTACTIPAEATRAAGGMFATFMTAYGPEADFAYPPRPTDPKAVWNLVWTAKVRFKSSAMVVPGMPDMAGMGRDSADDDSPAAPAEPAPKKKCKPSLGGILGGKIC